MTQTDDAIKPCPFCGGELACGRLRMAACRTDSCYMRNFVIDMDDPGSVARWNTRADLAPGPQDARVRALYDALYEIRDMLWSRPDISDRLRPLMGFAEEATNQKAAAALAAFDTTDTGGKNE